jgi:hypothetical protein
MGALFLVLSQVLQLLPVAATTVQGIRNLIASDPSVPAELAAILKSETDDSAAVHQNLKDFVAANPGV